MINPVDLSIYQTFDFAQDAPMVRASMAFPDLDARAADAAIRSSLRFQLTEKGYRQVEPGQLVVRFGLELREIVEVGGRVDFGARDNRIREGAIEATLRLSFTEAATGTDVWRIEADGPWGEGDTLQANIDRLVEGALRRVPSRE